LSFYNSNNAPTDLKIKMALLLVDLKALHDSYQNIRRLF